MVAVLAMALALHLPGFAQAVGGTSYDIEVALDPEAHTLSGTQRIDYVNDTSQAQETLAFFLFGNLGREPNPYLHPALLDGAYPDGFDSGWTRIHAVRDAGGQDVAFVLEAMPPSLQTFSLEDTVLRVPLNSPLAPGERVTFEIDFETKFAHAANIDAVFYENTYTWRFAWNPIVVSPSFFEPHTFELPAAGYRVQITLPIDLVLAAGAERQTVVEQDDAWQTVLLENDVPVRSVTLVMGPDFEVYTLHHELAKIDAYYLPGHQSQARLAASYAASQLVYYSERFGEYGYDRLVIVDNPGPGTYGMAADNVILVGTDNFRYKDLLIPGLTDKILEWLVGHEVGHLWWGIGVGTDFNAENWLSEGFAQYLSITYFEEKYGAFGGNVLNHLGDGLMEDLIKGELGYFNLRQHNVELAYLDTFKNRFDEEIIKRGEDTEYVNATASRIYQKGYLVLRALEGVLGRETMLKALKTAYERYGHQTASVALFQQVAEEVSGQDLDTFFQSWVYGDDYVDVAVKGFTSSETDTEGYETTVELVKRGPAVYPVTVQLETVEGEVLTLSWEADAEAGSVTFHSAAPAKRVSVDPEEMLLDVDRYNNHSPRKLVVKFGEADLPLDAYFIRLNQTGIQGSLGIDHAWSLNVLPRFEIGALPQEDGQGGADEAGEPLPPDTDPVEPDDPEGQPRLYLDAIGTLYFRLDRGLSLSGVLAATGYEPLAEAPVLDLSGELGVNWTLFEHPQIGAPGQFWYPANIFRFSVGVLGTSQQPLTYVGADYARLDVPRFLMTNAFQARAGWHEDGAFFRGVWTLFKRLRVSHNNYLDATLTLGSGMDALPEPMRLDLHELHGFAEAATGDGKAYGRLAYVLPPLSQLDFNLANLAILEGVTGSVFVQGGRVWEMGQPFSLEDARAEIGVEAALTLALPLGFPLGLNVGYAHPLRGAEPGAFGQVYVGVAGLF